MILCAQISMRKCNFVMEKEFAMVDACNGTIMMERSCACRALKVEGQELYAMMHDSDGGDR